MIVTIKAGLTYCAIFKSSFPSKFWTLTWVNETTERMACSNDNVSWSGKAQVKSYSNDRSLRITEFLARLVFPCSLLE